MKTRLLLALALILLVCSLCACELLGGLPPGETSAEPGGTPPGYHGTTSAGTTTSGQGNTPGDPHTHTPSDWTPGDADAHIKTCTACGDLLETAPHTKTAAGLVLPTLSAPGASSGEECTVCRQAFPSGADYPALSETFSRYAYRALLSHPNGEAMQAFYNDLLASAIEFHEAGTNAAETENGLLAFSASYSKLGLSFDEAFAALCALTTDCPIFYWIGRRAGGDGENLNVYTDEIYASAAVRWEYNRTVAAGVISMGLPEEGESAYTSVWRLHDTLIAGMDYAYEADGVTPLDAIWAYDILGCFVHQSGVCESYTEAASLLLNYWGIENIIATGTADGVNHAWNLVRLDDGEWYWLDITWDDQPSLATGRQYAYFCKTDAEFLTTARTLDIDLYTYPERAAAPYQTDRPSPGTAFTDGRFSYLISGYGDVEVTQVSGIGAVTVPSSVSYQGSAYAVISLGNLQDGTLHPVFASGITEVTLPASVQTVSGNTFGISTIERLRVAADSPYLTTDGTALYQTTTQTLLAYLPSATSTQLALPEGTQTIASGAILHNPHLQTLILPSTLTEIETLAVYNCTALASIRFSGTAEAFAKLTIQPNALPLEVKIGN